MSIDRDKAHQKKLDRTFESRDGDSLKCPPTADKETTKVLADGGEVFQFVFCGDCYKKPYDW